MGAGPPPDSDAASSSEAGLMSPSRSVQHSEAALMARCTQAVEQCRRDLSDLRAACKAANAHREKCAELLGAATEAVVALEDMLYDPDIDLRRERALQQLAGRVQNAMDQVGGWVEGCGWVGGGCCPGGGLAGGPRNVGCNRLAFIWGIGGCHWLPFCCWLLECCCGCCSGIAAGSKCFSVLAALLK